MVLSFHLRFALTCLVVGLAFVGTSHARGGRPIPIKYPYHTGGLTSCIEMPDDFMAKGASPNIVTLPHFGNDNNPNRNHWEASEKQVSANPNYPDMTFTLDIYENKAANPPYRLMNASIAAMGPKAKNGKWWFKLTSDLGTPFVDHYLLNNFDTCVLSTKLDLNHYQPIRHVEFQEYY